MSATGIVRRIDELGRIVIPKEIRLALKIRQGDVLEIYLDGNMMVVKPSSISDAQLNRLPTTDAAPVVLNMPRKPLVWGDDDHETCLCPDCGADLMGLPYGERMILQCPVCGQYLDATKIITRAEAEAALGGGGDANADDVREADNGTD